MAVFYGRQMGAWLERPGPEAQVKIRSDLPIPEPGVGEVLIKLECTGVWSVSSCFMDSSLDYHEILVGSRLTGCYLIISHSDVHNMHGHTPMTTNIGGHEGVGRVVKGSQRRILPIVPCSILDRCGGS